MKIKHIIIYSRTSIYFIFILIISIQNLSAQNNLVEISGQIKDIQTKETLIGVTLVVKGTSNGAATDADGKFKIRTKLSYPFTLVVSYVGYETQEYIIKDPNQEIRINLSSQNVQLNDVVVTASRVEERIMQSPVSIEKLDIKTLRESPSASFYDALENVKGVQMTQASLTFKVPNTRGFNAPNNFRFMQLVDGVDMQAATLGVPLGNTIGPTELDIETVEITPGAASALYGMNAINGMANMFTKNPFRYQGLSIYQKVGANHVDGKDRPFSILSETAVRMAKVLNEKLAFKLNMSYMRGTDWVSSNPTDQNAYSLSNPRFPQFQSGANNVAYDAWNKYGDENNNNIPVSVLYNGKNQTFNVRRTGFWEKDLTEAVVSNLKFDGSIHYKLKENLELSYTYRVGVMDGTFQRGNKIRLNGTNVQIHKLELKSKYFTFNNYISLENTGNSYNLKALADNLDLTSSSNSTWGADYKTTLQNALNNGTNLNTANLLARDFADRNRFQPGSETFDEMKNKIISINNWDHASNVAGAPATGGAALIQNSRMYHSEFQYDFTHLTKKYVDILVGADARMYEVIPDGNNFVDFSRPIADRNKPGGNNVYYSKVGAFVQATKRILNDRLKFVASFRYDKNFEFEGKFNPRLAVVYTPSQNHSFRFSLQNGFRFPALFEALSYVNNGNVRRVGGLTRINEGLGYLDNSYTLASVNDFNNAVNTEIANGISQNQAALNQVGKLVKSNLGATQPEEIRSIELGYKAILFANSFVIDFDTYLNQYSGFLGQVEVSVPNAAITGSDAATLAMLNRNTQTRYRVFTNAKNTYYNYGSGLRLSYHFQPKWNISGNLNYNDLVNNSTPDVFVTGFNTPRFSTNLSFGNKEIIKNLGFNVVWRWQDSFLWESPLANGIVPSFWTLDAQITYKVPSLLATAKLGASNLLNNRYIQYAAGPTIGGLYYLAITFDGIFSDENKKMKD